MEADERHGEDILNVMHTFKRNDNNSDQEVEKGINNKNEHKPGIGGYLLIPCSAQRWSPR